METSTFIKKVGRESHRIGVSAVKEVLRQFIDDVKAIIIEEYDAKLTDVVTDKDSKSNPIFYRDSFIERLDNFEYVSYSADGTFNIRTPELDTFDFSGRLRVIEVIMHGIVGEYVEVNEEQYVSVYNKKPINEEPLDIYVSPKERIYLVKYSPAVKNAEKKLNKKFVSFPFSNTPPIEIFAAGDKYLDDNIGSMTDKVITYIMDTVGNNYKGVKTS